METQDTLEQCELVFRAPRIQRPVLRDILSGKIDERQTFVGDREAARAGGDKKMSTSA